MNGQPRAGAAEERTTSGDKRLGEQRIHPLGERMRLLDAAKPLEEENELVAPQSGDRILLPHRLVESAGDRNEQDVAGLVSVRVVDLLEAVEVEKEHRDVRVFAA